MIPVYLRIAVILTGLAGGYCLWDDFVRSPDDLAGPTSVRSTPPLLPTPRQVTTSHAVQKPRRSEPEIDLFPDQRIVLAPEIEAPAFVRPSLPPQPPSLPFQISGVWVEGGQRKIIVDDGRKMLIVCRRCEDSSSLGEGDLLDEKYRIEKIDNEQITLTYLPMRVKQVVRLDKAMADTGT